MSFSRSRFTRTTVVTAIAACLVISASVATVAAARAPKPPAGPIVTAKASTAQPGGRINLNVGIKTSGKVGAASATAVAHFASGDVTVRIPKVVKLKTGASITGTVPVPAAELPGPVTLDFTIVYAGTTYLRSTTTTVEPTPTPVPTPTVAPIDEAVPTAAPTDEAVPTP